MSYLIIKGCVFVFVLTSYHSSGFLLDTTATSACFDQLQNCDIFNATFGACKDPHNAYQYCRKFCGLCSVVHGGWSVWSAWSVCDATCGNGTMTRSRQCNNPSPYNGGDDCQGPSQNIGECLFSRCPTHGGWGAWSEWGTCSVTCGVGLRRRDRACDNPWPSRDGNHCFGDNINYEICTQTSCSVWSGWGSWSACSNTCGYGFMERTRNCTGPPGQMSCVGSDFDKESCRTSCNAYRYWSAWGSWSACSNTCGYGLMERTRSCTGPADQMSCMGSDVDKDICRTSCNAYRYWSAWGSWSACSNTCGYGLRERIRNCTGPPDQMSCTGNDVDKDSCRTSCNSYRYWSSWGSWGSCADTCGNRKRTRTCSGSTDLVNQCIGNDHEDGLCPTNSHDCTSAFTISGLVQDTSGLLKFMTFGFNDGNDYNPTTGVFTCRVPGRYYFAFSLTKIGSTTIRYVYASLELNGSGIAAALSEPIVGSTDNGSNTIGTSATVHLNRGDMITVKGSAGTSFVSSYCTFTGHLISPDTV